MTDLTRERLAELRAVAEKANGTLGDAPWYETRSGGLVVVVDDDAAHIAAFDPPTVLTLIAQCEAGLPASGGVSGEDGELIARLRFLSKEARHDDPTDPDVRNLADAADRIVALLAERDGLKDDAHYAKGVADLAMKHRDVAEAALSASNAALAEAVGLLRNAAGNETWHAAVTDFLAKHGPSP